MVTLGPNSDAASAAQVLQRYGAGVVHVGEDRRQLSVPVDAEPGLITRVVRDLEDAGVVLDDLGLHRPTLDDVFLTLTGHAVDDVRSTRPSNGTDAKEQIGEEAA